jgi:hypothetical protein
MSSATPSETLRTSSDTQTHNWPPLGKKAAVLNGGTELRTQLTIYLPDELCERFKHEATRQGLSLSAYVTRQLAASTDQISQLQFWLNTRIDGLGARLVAVHVPKPAACNK